MSSSIPIYYNAIIRDSMKIVKNDEDYNIILENPSKNVVCYQTWDSYTPLSNGEKLWKTFGLNINSLMGACKFNNLKIEESKLPEGNKFLPTILIFIENDLFYLTITKFDTDTTSDSNIITLTATKFNIENNDIPDSYEGECKIYMSKIPSDIIVLSKNDSNFIEWLNPYFTSQGNLNLELNENIVNKSIQFFFKDNLVINKGSNRNEFKITLNNPNNITIYQTWSKFAPLGNIDFSKKTVFYRNFSDIYEAFVTHKNKTKSQKLDKYGSMFNFYPGTIITINDNNYLTQITDIQREENRNETYDNQNSYIITVNNNKYLDYSSNSSNWSPLPLGSFENVCVNVDSCSNNNNTQAPYLAPYDDDYIFY